MTRRPYSFFRSPSQPSHLAASVTEKSRFAPYKQALSILADRTRTPFPSLIISFAVLHELTMFVPLVAFFLAARELRAGERVMLSYPDKFQITQDPSKIQSKYPDLTFWGRVRREWWIEGRLWADHVMRRYGLFGFPRESKGISWGSEFNLRERTAAEKAAPDVANLVMAYFLTKGLLPVRLGLSIYWSPAFSRGVIEPTRNSIMRAFRRQAR